MPKTKTINDEIKHELTGILFIAISIFVSLCLWQGSNENNSTTIGTIGTFIYRVLTSICGSGKFVIPVFLLFGGICKITKRIELDKITILSAVALLVSILALFHIQLPTDMQSFATGYNGLGGGIIGAIFARVCFTLFGRGGSYILLSVLIVLSTVGILKKTFKDIIKQIYCYLEKMFSNIRQELVEFLFEQTEESEKEKKEKKRDKINKINTKNSSENTLIIDHIDHINEEKHIIQDMEEASNLTSPVLIKPCAKERTGKDLLSAQDATEKRLELTEKSIEDYVLPPLGIIQNPPKVKSLRLNKDITDKVRILEETLNNFGVKARVTQVSKGPSITRYEIQPPPGIKVSRIVNLTDDIALSLAAPQVRIEAPIPGKAAVGIEVPNSEVSIVSLREVLETSLFQDSSSKLTVALGKDIAGNPIVADLGKMPHLLIAGATGSGKSVCMNALIASILFKSSPKEVKMLMIDPKVVELSTFNGIPHLISPVVTDSKKAASALRWVIHEMENRYELFANLGVKDIKRYNQIMQNEAGKDGSFPLLPYIVVLIDELADLMMVAPGDVEDAICRLAQMARAAGIHLVIATQRPSVDVITGVIKANIPSRIAFAVSSQTDSRTILDMGGAEHLLGRGDMLFYPTGMAKPLRVQGVYVSDQEIDALVDHLKAQGKPVNETEPWKNDNVEITKNVEEDPLLFEAAKLLIDSGQASISLLQRRLKVGYNRAARIVDQLEEKGVIGGYEGSKPRAVKMTWEEFENKYVN
ncbi:MAG: DNA translocase FtsK 4TM domain-containing protein [Clostridia bacterium]|nr:DNA translocase FtsK 4TM domain-containing protein [Clostridia bacterium]